ncbi:MAG: saccharopine dehydrogenase NADP-binding domain-containing protein [Pseudobacteriovorax sp.]|nr:saccharopine dehydrogenase NADP-binding domain-containing protein [Pseudobacteriovorax sp.]
MGARDYDVVIFGATGFVGKLLCEYFRDHVKDRVSWAIAGRSLDKLKALSEALSLDAGIIIADSRDDTSLLSMAARTRVVLTTVGPYLRYGEPLVKACIEQETHYCDLTGEVPFIYNMIAKYHHSAAEQSVKIVHCCGFDSIPSDIGALVLQNYLKSETGDYAEKLEYVLSSASGSLSRGTLESLMDVVSLAGKDPDVRRYLRNANCLTELGEIRGRDQMSVKFHKGLDRWTAPFLMETVNTRIVRRSHFLMGCPYSSEFEYTETAQMPRGAKGFLAGQGLRLFMGTLVAASLSKPSRKAISLLMPDVGEGPSRKSIEKGFFHVEILAYRKKTDTDAMAAVTFKGFKDPGYGATAIMQAEAAIVLSSSHESQRYGVGTPAAMIGTELADALVEQGFVIKPRMIR